MKNVLQLSGVVFLAALTWSTLTITYNVRATLKATTSTIANVDGAVRDMHVTTVKLNATLDNVAAATSQLELAAADERKYWNQTSQESAKAMRDLRQLAARLDRSINDKLIPDLDLQIVQTSTSAQNSLEALQHSAETLTFQLNDPAIAQMADHLNLAAANVADASKNVSDGTAHLAHATADIESEVHRLTRPPSMAKQIGIGLLDVGAKLGSIFAGFVR